MGISANVTELGTSVSLNVGGSFNSIDGETALFYATLDPAPNDYWTQ